MRGLRICIAAALGFALVIAGKGATVLIDAAAAEKHLHEGVGVIVAIDASKSRLVVDHEEIKGFMAPMVMGYMVTPATLLQDLKPGDSVRFTIDANERVVVDIQPLRK